jgi:hypothetical protein
MDPRGIFTRRQLKEKFLVLIDDSFPSVGLTDAVGGPKPISRCLLRIVLDVLQFSRQVIGVSVEQDTEVLQHFLIEGCIQSKDTISAPQRRQQRGIRPTQAVSMDVSISVAMKLFHMICTTDVADKAYTLIASLS